MDNSIYTTYTTEIEHLKFSIYYDLDIKGYSHNFRKLIDYKYAATYASIVVDNVNSYGLTEEEAELKYHIKSMRHRFGCVGINIDELFNSLNLEYYDADDDTLNSQFANERLCDLDTILIPNPIIEIANDGGIPLTSNDNTILIL
jgi:hypothetical protein